MSEQAVAEKAEKAGKGAVKKTSKLWLIGLRVEIRGRTVTTEIGLFRGSFSIYAERKFRNPKAAQRWYDKAQKDDGSFCLKTMYRGLTRKM